MKEESILEKEDIVRDRTLNLRSLIGARVISSGGLVAGRIKEVRVNPKSMGLQGILISRGIFKKFLYVGKSYFDRISNDAIILNIDPFVFLKGKKVISSDGRVVGRIRDIKRSDETNNIKSIIITTIFRRFNIPVENVKLLGKSVLLKIDYDGAKKYIQQRS
ncbi:MAG: PRC-barrel domain-containing protein [Nanoarchaeota archaeon]|nr:PRC-barrel domain-containing protein [Nanoarchaeota archaeon]